MNDATRRQFRIDLLVVLLTAIVVRLAYLFQYLRSPYYGIHLVDQAYYRNWAWRIASGDWIGDAVFEQGPLYAYLLAVPFKLGMGDGIVLLLQLLVGTITSLLVYLCAKRLATREVALIAGVTAASCGPLVYYECMIMKTFLSPFFTMLALYAGLRFADHYARRWLFLSGAAVGLACLLQENHILLLIPILIWLRFGHLVNPVVGSATSAKPKAFRSTSDAATTGQMSWKASVKLMLLPVFGCFIFILPATVHNYVAAQEIVLVTSGGGEVFYMAHGPYATGNYEPPPFVRGNPYLEHEDFRYEAEKRLQHPVDRGESSRYWASEAWMSVLVDPLRSFKLTCNKLIGLFNNYEVPDSQTYSVTQEFILLLSWLPPFGPFVGLGMAGLYSLRKEWRRFILPLGFASVFILSVVLTYNFGRFRAGILPVWFIFSAMGLQWLWTDASTGGERKWSQFAVKFSVVIVVTVLAFVTPGHVSTEQIKREAQKRRETVKQMAIVARKWRELERRVSENPSDRSSLQRQLGTTYLELGRFYEAFQVFDQLLEIYPNDAGIHLQYAEGLSSLARFDLAAEHYRQASQNAPSSAEVRLKFGAMYAMARQWRESLDQLNQAAVIAPDNVGVQLNLGRVFMELCIQTRDGESIVKNPCEKGLESFERVISLAPNDNEAYVKRALLLITLGRTSDALRGLYDAVNKNLGLIESESVLDSMFFSGRVNVSTRDTALAARILQRLAEQAFDQQRYADAIRLADKGVPLARAGRDPKLAEALQQASIRYTGHK